MITDFENFDLLHAKILIIEDNLSHIKIYERVFEPFTGRIFLKNVTNLEDAEKYLKTETPDLILLDLFLENDLGEDLLNRSSITEKYPVIVMTSFGSEEIAVKAIKAGAMDYLVKSNENFKQLPHMVRRTLREWGSIQKLREAEKALQESEAFYRSLLEWANDFIFVIDKNGEIKSANKSLAEAMGLSPDPSINIKIMHTSENSVYIQQLLKKVFEDKKPISYEHSMPMGRDPQYFSTILSPIFDNNGDVLYVSGVTRNITAQREAEIALRKSEQLWKNISQNASEYILILDMDGVITYLNRPVKYDLLRDVTGKKLEDYLPEQLNHQFRRVLEKVKISQNTEKFNFSFPIDGTITLDIEGIIGPLVEDGKICGYTVTASDVSERAAHKRILAESERRFQTVADFTFDWEYWLEPSGELQYISPSCQRITGYSQEEFYNHPGLLSGIIHPDDKELFSEHSDRDSGFKSSSIIEYRIIKTDGSECWIEHYCQAVYDQENNWLGRRVSNRDVTQRKKVEQKIVESEQRFRLLSEASFEGILFIRNMREIIDVNKQMLQMLGYKREELVGKNIIDIIPEDLQKIVIERIKNKEELDGVDGHIFHKDGHELFISIRTKMIELNGEKVRVMIMRDISESVKAREALETSEMRFMAFMENLPVSVFYKNSEWKYQYVNPLCEKINGFSKGVWKDKTAWDLFPEEAAEIYQKNDSQVLNERKLLINKDSVKLSGGEVTYWENIIFPFEDVSGNQFIGGIGINTTERELAEKAIQASEKRLTILSESTFEGIIFTENGFIMDANDQFVEIFGYELTEVIGKAVLDFIHPEDETLLAHGLGTSKENKLREVRGIHKDGREVFLNITNRLMEIQGKDIWIMIFRDISEQKITEKALLSSELRFKAFVENIPATIIHKDSMGRYIYVNSNFLRDMGIENENDWKEKSDFELYPQSLAERFRSNDLIILKNGIPMVNEDCLLLKGKELYRENIKFRFSDAEGNSFIGMIGIDIEERVKTQNALKESELRYKELFNNSKSAISVYEVLENGKEFVFKDYNQTAERLNRISREEIIGKKVGDVFPELKESGFLSAVAQVWKSGKPLEVSRKYHNSTKTAGWRNNYIYRLPSGEIVVIYEDVTEQVLVEEERERQKRELERTNQLITYLNKIVTRIEGVLEPGEVIYVLHEEFTNLGLDHFIAPFTRSDNYIEFIEHSIKSEAVSNLIPILNQAIAQIKKSPEKFPLIEKIIKKRQVVYSNRVIPALLDAAVGVLEKENLMDIHSEFDQVKAVLVERLMFLMPLFGEDDFFGLIGIGGKYLKTSDLVIFSNFSNQISLSISKTQLLEKVRDGRARLQTLSNRLIEVQEDERKFLAQELHDEVGQTLTGLKLTLQAKQEGQLTLALHLIDELSEKVENLSLDLRPSILDDLGLQPALLWLMERFTHLTQVEVRFEHSGITDRRFTTEIETAVYRIIQEALTNVARHSGVSKANVNLLADTNKIYFEVRDDGKGMNLTGGQLTKRSGGLLGMRERAEILMGSFSIVSKPGEGTLVSAEIPLRKSIERRTKERNID